jgi:hypothetical protein
MSIVDWLIVAPAIPAAPVFITWWLPWEKWIPWDRLPKSVLGLYLIYLSFVFCHFDTHFAHWWCYVWLAVVGVMLLVIAIREKVKTEASK